MRRRACWCPLAIRGLLQMLFFDCWMNAPRLSAWQTGRRRGCAQNSQSSIWLKNILIFIAKLSVQAAKRKPTSIASQILRTSLHESIPQQRRLDLLFDLAHVLRLGLEVL